MEEVNKGKQLNLNDFSFHVPDDQVAHFPAKKRDSSKLLFYKGKSEIKNFDFKSLPDILPQGTLLIFNNTKVFPCRLQAQKDTGAQLEVFLLSLPNEKNPNCQAIVKPIKRIKTGTKLYFQEGVIAEVGDFNNNGSIPTVSLKFFSPPGVSDFHCWIDRFGQTPLPPYIKRQTDDSKNAEIDKKRYQTVYARCEGSTAAPTAGLHFTKDLLEELERSGIKSSCVTLHVGLGTFAPVRNNDIKTHKMHKEFYFIPSETFEAIKENIRSKNPIVAVGTTSLRAVESLFYHDCKSFENLSSYVDAWNETDLFIYPKTKNDFFSPRVLDGLITNFHQPQSTLYMLISALLGFDEAKRVYDYAVKNKFRFFSYGDSSLLWFKKKEMDDLKS